MIRISEPRLFAAYGADACTLVYIETSAIDSAIFKHPAFVHGCLKIKIGIIDMFLRHPGDDFFDSAPIHIGRGQKPFFRQIQHSMIHLADIL